MDTEPRRDTYQTDVMAMELRAWFFHLSLQHWAPIEVHYPWDNDGTTDKQYVQARSYINWYVGEYLHKWVWGFRVND